MTECRPRRAGGLLRARKKSHTPAAGAGLPAGGPGKGIHLGVGGGVRIWRATTKEQRRRNRL